MSDHDLASWLRLTLTPGIGRVRARQLLTAFGEPNLVLEQTRSALESVVGSKLAGRLLTPTTDDIQNTISLTEAWLLGGTNRHILTVGDPRYPADLLQTADPPLLLYVLGHLAALQNGNPRLAVVGSRNPTPQGVENARGFARELAHAGVCVVSGLALGIDAAAHEGALQAGGLTIAVVGTGLDRVYPRQNRDLAHAITAQGAVVSEFPIGTGPLPAHFPQRNRIISGLTTGTLVVEAALQSGSLITAQAALEQGRDVYAIPGSIHAPLSKGCHALIKQGAQLVEAAQDILDTLQLGSTGAPLLAPTANAAEPNKLLRALGHEPSGLDALQARTGMDVSTLQGALLELELEGHVQRLPGGIYTRLVRA